MKAFPLMAASLLAATALLSGFGGLSQGQAAGHPTGACSAPYWVSGAGWDVCWQQDDPRVQGLELTQVYFHGESVAWRMGVPFTLTQYDTTSIGPFKDTLGNPGAGGHPGYGLGSLTLATGTCPRFFEQGTLLNNNHVCVEQHGGPEPAIALWSRFNIYNYRFLQGWILDARGVIQPVIAMGGQLIDGSTIGSSGHNHFHHLYVRMDLDVAAAGNDVFQAFHRVAGGFQSSGAFSDAAACQVKGSIAVTTWCDVPVEARLLRDPLAVAKWRVRDSVANNALGRDRSYELNPRSDGPANHFSSMDVMVVQYKGDSAEIGYEVPTTPSEGDGYLVSYVAPPEQVTDPVVWVALHAYHDTRDEDRGSMTPHYASFEMRPNNFFGTNPGVSSYP